MVDLRYIEGTPEQVLSYLRSFPQGLSDEEAKKRLKKYGKNIIAKEERPSLINIFLRQFASPLVGMLFLVFIVALLMGELLDALVILLVVLVNAIIGTYHENNTYVSMSALRDLSRGKVKVIRSGEIKEVFSEDVVVGDVLWLSQGDKVPADARIIWSRGLRVDESTLTGEPISVAKFPEPINTTKVKEMINFLFAGTFIISGEAKAVVAYTGSETLLGRVYGKLSEKEEFPIAKKMREFTKTLMKYVAFGVALFLILSNFLGYGLIKTFELVVAQAVSFIPEGLPIVVTVAMAVSAYDMAKKKALVRKLEAIEAIGQVEFLCIDKTGTLTMNKIMLERIVVGKESFHFKDGHVLKDGREEDPLQDPYFIEVLELAALSSVYRKVDGEYRGDPLDTSIVERVGSLPISINIEELSKVYECKEEFPFDVSRKNTAKLYRKGKGYLMVIKGSPEELLNSSSYFVAKGKKKRLTKTYRKYFYSKLEELASKGYRVIALAVKESQTRMKDVPRKGLVFASFLCFWDPIRKEARKTIEELTEAGVKVMMITGDHPSTGKSVAKMVGLKGKAITEEELFKIPPQDLYKELLKTSVISRATIEGKLRVIEVLKKNGKVVAMTGDGVNDAPALHGADVGISLGSGTDVAREASDIVILDDNIKSISSAVEEGRRGIINIMKTVRYLFATNITEVVFLFTLFFSPIFYGRLLEYPLKAIHILYVNLVTDGLCDVTIATEGQEKELNKRKPSYFKGGYWKAETSAFVIVGAAVSLAILLFSYFMYIGNEKQTTAVLTTLVLLQLWSAFSSRKIGNAFDLLSNKLLVGAATLSIVIQVVVIYTPISEVMGLVPLSIYDWLVALFLSSFLFFSQEATKLLLPLFRVFED